MAPKIAEKGWFQLNVNFRFWWAQAASRPTWSLWLSPSLPVSSPHTSVSFFSIIFFPFVQSHLKLSSSLSYHTSNVSILSSKQNFMANIYQISPWWIQWPGTKKNSLAWWLSLAISWRGWGTQVTFQCNPIWDNFLNFSLFWDKSL